MPVCSSGGYYSLDAILFLFKFSSLEIQNCILDSFQRRIFLLGSGGVSH